MSAVLELQKVIYERLIADTTLTGFLGGTDIFDGVPSGARLPYVVFGKSETDDWSTGTEAGEEHLVELVVWSSSEGRKEAVQISSAIRNALHDLPTDLTTERLANFSWETMKIERREDLKHVTATLTFRAVTEPASE